MGSHALQNLYPVLQYLGIRLKYICCKSPDKLEAIERRFGVTATTSLETVLNDGEVKGVFVCTSPQSHYDISRQVIKSGKYLFVEKPPCQTPDQLESLVSADRRQLAMAGMQKRFSPVAATLKSRLSGTTPVSYTMMYRTGAYPEGDPLTDLFIYPADFVIWLFGKSVIKDCQVRRERNGLTTIQILLSNGDLCGLMELSTAYSWSCPEETLQINTSAGEYRLIQMEKLCHCPHPGNMFGIPVEKIGLFTPKEQILAARNNFSPIVTDNQIYMQGFFSEIKAFADMVEHGGRNLSPFVSLTDTYEFLYSIKRKFDCP